MELYFKKICFFKKIFRENELMMMGFFFFFFWGVIVMGGIKRKVTDIFLHHESNVDSTFINPKIMKKRDMTKKDLL